MGGLKAEERSGKGGRKEKGKERKRKEKVKEMWREAMELRKEKVNTHTWC